MQPGLRCLGKVSTLVEVCKPPVIMRPAIGKLCDLQTSIVDFHEQMIELFVVSYAFAD